MTQQTSAEIQEIAQTIGRYLSAHPDAADTLDGINSDWLKKERVMATTQQVQQAISLLIDRGLMRQKNLPDGTMLFMRRR